MRNKKILYALLPAILGLGYLTYDHYDSIWCKSTIDGIIVTPSKKFYYHYTKPDGQVFSFNLIDPEEAPAEIHDQVMEGYRIFNHTPEFAKEFVTANISCTNCHFCGGNTLGGFNGGISLAGVTHVYPKYSARSKRTLSLLDRMENCFMRSLNGTPPPEDHPIMQNLLVFLDWISQEFKDLQPIPWLGLKYLTSKHVPDAEQGKVVYAAHCSRCHQPDGQGSTGIPPLWGARSFNDGAGMNTMEMLSAFVYYNMPYESEKPMLTPEQALDVAAFIIKQPRPHFEAEKK